MSNRDVSQQDRSDVRLQKQLEHDHARLERQLQHDRYRLERQLEHDRYLGDREAFRINERERIKAGYQGAMALGAFVLKGLVAVNSGAMIAVVNLLNQHGELAGAMYTFLASLMFSLGAAFLGYLNGIAIQELGDNRLAILDEKDIEKREALDSEWAQISKRVRGTQEGAVALAWFSAALFVGGILMSIDKIL